MPRMVESAPNRIVISNMITTYGGIAARWLVAAPARRGGDRAHTTRAGGGRGGGTPPTSGGAKGGRRAAGPGPRGAHPKTRRITKNIGPAPPGWNPPALIPPYDWPLVLGGK